VGKRNLIHGRRTALAEDLASRKALGQVVEGYLTRGRVEDAIRFVKQSYHLEGIRVLKYRRLKNRVALRLAVIYFNCVWLAGRLRSFRGRDFHRAAHGVEIPGFPCGRRLW
jgi:hypothetical protein